MSPNMRKIRTLKDVVLFRDPDGAVTARKGTTCNLVHDGRHECVEKQWVSGDWVFPADYEYGVEKHVYQHSNAVGLPVPELLGFDDAERKLLIEYIPRSPLEAPCSDEHLLRQVLRFFDEFRRITFPELLPLRKMDGEELHEYRLNQLRFIFPNEQVWTRIDSIYESFLESIPYCTIPFDRILHNAILHDGRLFFIDFEWTIAGPYEFPLARAAVEFNQYDDPRILARTQDRELYHLFLLRFYMYGREPQKVNTYLTANLANPDLRELFGIVTAQRYAGEEWYR